MCGVIGTIAAFAQLAKYTMGTSIEMTRFFEATRSALEKTREWDDIIQALSSRVGDVSLSAFTEDTKPLIRRCEKQLQAVKDMRRPLDIDATARRRQRWTQNLKVALKEKPMDEAIASLHSLLERIQPRSTYFVPLSLLPPSIHLTIFYSVQMHQPAMAFHAGVADLHEKNNYAVILFQQGKASEAEDLFRRTAQALSSILRPSHPDTLHVYQNLASLLRDMKRYPEAEKLARTCSESMCLSFAPHDVRPVSALRNLAIILQWQGKFRDALVFAKRAHERWSRSTLR